MTYTISVVDLVLYTCMGLIYLLCAYLYKGESGQTK